MNEEVNWTPKEVSLEELEQQPVIIEEITPDPSLQGQQILQDSSLHSRQTAEFENEKEISDALIEDSLAKSEASVV